MLMFKKMPKIVVSKIKKEYNIPQKENQSRTLKSDILSAAKKLLFLKNKESKNNYQALNNINFSLSGGDIVGIIGENGSGKSTLLKLISGVTTPTEGEIIVQGKVISLLEVGAGFHPELTGRENIFLNGAIYGMSKKETESKIKDIIEFAGIDKFLDTPVKYYSSGMYVRLAFSIATSINADIILLDEVLSVGDMEFQEKSLSRIKKIVKDKNKIILFVSHNLEAVKKICNLAILIRGGYIKNIGDPKFIVNEYISNRLTLMEYVDFKKIDAPGNKNFKLKYFGLITDASSQPTVSDAVQIKVSFWSLLRNNNVNLSLVIYRDDQCAFNSISPIVNLEEGLYEFICVIPGGLLNNGYYFAELIVSRNLSANHIFKERIKFLIDDQRSIDWFGEWVGVVRPDLNWQIKKV